MTLAKKTSYDMAWSKENIAFSSLMALVWLLGSIILPQLLLFWTPICISILMGGIAYQIVNQLENRANKTLGQKLNDTWNFIGSYWVSLIFGSWMLNIAIAIVSLLLKYTVIIITSIPEIGNFLGSLLVIPIFVCLLSFFALYIYGYLLPSVVAVEKTGPIRSINLLVNIVTNNPLELFLGYVNVILSILPIGLLTGIITFITTFASVLICKASSLWFILNNLDSGWELLNFIDDGMLSISIRLIFYAWISCMLAFASTGFTMVYYNATRRGQVS